MYEIVSFCVRDCQVARVELAKLFTGDNFYRFHNHFTLSINWVCVGKNFVILAVKTFAAIDFLCVIDTTAIWLRVAQNTGRTLKPNYSFQFWIIFLPRLFIRFIMKHFFNYLHGSICSVICVRTFSIRGINWKNLFCDWKLALIVSTSSGWAEAKISRLELFMNS